MGTKRNSKIEETESVDESKKSRTSDDGLSLDEINAAFSKLIDQNENRNEQRDEAENWMEQVAATRREQTPEFQVTPIRIVESFLFVGKHDNSAITAEEMAKLMRGVRAEEVDGLIQDLNKEYARDGNVYEIVSEKGGYRLVLKKSFSDVRNKFYGKIKDAQLSQAAVDILAVIAYKQPIDREHIESLRGRPCGGILNQLVRRELVSVEKSTEKGKRRNKIYRTTDRFLDIFGLETIEDLPSSQRIDFVD